MENLSGTGGAAASTTNASAQSAAYSLAAKISMARDLGPSLGPIAKTPSLQIDPSVLAKAAIEDEIRRKRTGGGGGGGGSRELYGPALWVPYTLRLMNIVMAENRAFFNQVFQQLVNFIPNAINNFSEFVGGGFANLSKSFATALGESLNQMQRQANKILEGLIKSPVNMAMALGSSVSHLANAIGNALTQGLKKSIYGKDEKDEENFETNKDARNIFDQFSDWIKNFKSDNN